MATTTTVNTRRTIHNRRSYTDKHTLYWIVGAIVLAAFVVFFSMGRDSAEQSVLSQPAAISGAPTTVEQSTSPGQVPPASSSSVDSSAAGTGAIDMENSNLTTE